MTLPVWQRNIVDDNGDVVPSAEITIRDEATGLFPVAGVFSDRAGSNALTDGSIFADVNGFIQFFTAPAEIRVTAAGAPGGATWRYIVLPGTAAQADLSTSSGDTTSGRVWRLDDLVKALNSTDATLGSVLLNGHGGLLSSVLSVDWDTISFDGGGFNRSNTDGPPGLSFPAGLTVSNKRLELAGRGGRSFVRDFVDSPTWFEHWTDKNLEVSLSGGKGKSYWMKNVSGGNIVDTGSISGASIEFSKGNTSGVVVSAGVSPSGTWKNVNGSTLANNEFGEFVRTS